MTRADELEVLTQQAQADLSHKQAQLDLAERMNQKLQRQAMDQAVESERSKQAEIQQLQNDIIGLQEQVTESSKVVGVRMICYNPKTTRSSGCKRKNRQP